MIFKVGDKVIFKEDSYHIDKNNKFGFTKNREYVIISVEEYIGGYIYVIKNNFKIKDYILGKYIILSTSGSRNRIIYGILE